MSQITSLFIYRKIKWAVDGLISLDLEAALVHRYHLADINIKAAEILWKPPEFCLTGPPSADPAAHNYQAESEVFCQQGPVQAQLQFSSEGLDDSVKVWEEVLWSDGSVWWCNTAL